MGEGDRFFKSLRETSQGVKTVPMIGELDLDARL
jgi:hypothetical protein